jgi:hypothetical protein
MAKTENLLGLETADASVCAEIRMEFRNTV